MATVNEATTVDDVFEYQPPRIVFEEASGDVTASIPDECVEFMDGVRRSLRETGNPNPVFGFNEHGALFRTAMARTSTC